MISPSPTSALINLGGPNVKVIPSLPISFSKRINIVEEKIMT